jgi:UDP-N-acetyl-D-mannosaminuronate dehydrogenase
MQQLEIFSLLDANERQPRASARQDFGGHVIRVSPYFFFLKP